MTFSIVAFDPPSQGLGIATATGNIAVGGFVPHLELGVGAIATQGFSTNFWYGPNGLSLLRNGMDAQKVIERLTAADAWPDWRQCAVVSVKGSAAGWTGVENRTEMGHMCQENLAVAGNYLVSKAVLSLAEETFLTSSSESFALRLLEALEAAQAEGGDRRSTTSAALKVIYPDDLPVDIRVDNQDGAIGGLRDLYAAMQESEYQSFLKRLPTPRHPDRH